MAWAQDLARPYDQAGALCGIVWLYQHCGDVPVMQARIEAVVALSAEQGFVLLLAMGHVFRGWMLAERGQPKEGITEMNRGCAVYRAKKASNLMPYFLALLGEVHGRARQAENGLVALAEALEIVSKTGECQQEAELYRLKGTLTLQEANQKSKGKRQKSKVTDSRPLTPNPQSEAEACFHKAIEVAQRQQAKSLEVRATTSLARLWQSQGKQREAHHMLAEVYGWFTEGFDTKALQEAQTLLQELADHHKV